jgi:predicted amidohydrolase YtcJ
MSKNTAYTNGKIYTVNKKQLWAEAVLIENGKFKKVGTNKEIESHTNKNTKVIDLKGKMVLPGMIDSHNHGILSSYLTTSLNVSLIKDKGEMVNALRKFAADTPGNDPVVGFGWHTYYFKEGLAPKELLDEIFGERPVVIIRSDGHGAWGNTAAFKKAGIDKNTPDPIPGMSYFSRKSNGEPAGLADEFAAWLMLALGVKEVTKEYIEKTFPKITKQYAQLGLTAIFDPGVFLIDETEAMSAVQNVDKKGLLHARYFGTHYTTGTGKKIDHFKIAEALADKFPMDIESNIAVNAIKINIDGSFENKTGLLLEPYKNDNSKGLPMFSRDMLKDMISKSYDTGIDLHLHIMGDGGVRLALDIIEEVRNEKGEKDIRTNITHGILVDKDDMPRFTPLNAGYSTAVEWMVVGENLKDYKKILGKRACKQHLLKSLVNTGVRIGNASDYCVATTFPSQNPMDMIEMAVTRQDITDPNSPVFPPKNERISLKDAIKMVTIWNAWLMHIDDIAGSIEEGKSADMVVLNQNLFDIKPREIHKTKVLRTVFRGEIAYRK